MESAVEKARRRKNLTLEEKKMVINVYEGLRERDPNISTSAAVKLCSFLTKVSETTVYSCLKSKASCEDLSTFPAMPKKTRGRKPVEIDNDTRQCIRRIIHSFFLRNEVPSAKKIEMAIAADDSLPSISNYLLLKTLKDMKFRYLKRNRNSLLIEKPEIVLWRRNYIRKIRQFRREGRKVYWMDETWLNAGHTVNKVWQDLSVTSSRQAFLEGLSTGLKAPSGKGRRLIVTHIGSDTGFLDGGLLLFESKSTGDYHEEMNAQTFEKWFSSILARVEPGSVIVLDNAPYHSRRTERQPTSSWRKDQIVEWLRDKGISHDDQMLKIELLNIARQHKTEHIKYVIDEMAQQYNMEVLRLPPYHCELNPIEMIWAQVKGEVARKNSTFKLADVSKLLEQAIGNVTAETWKKCIGHVEKEEDRMWEIDRQTEMVVEPLIITLNGSDSETETEDDTSD